MSRTSKRAWITSSSATAEATFGIYSAWGLKVSGGETFNQRLGSGAFRGHGLGISVIRRF